jgi:hypothetical protein
MRRKELGLTIFQHNYFFRIVVVYGCIAGAITIAMTIAATNSQGTIASTSAWFGYLIMLISLSLIFAGVKRYRDIQGGGYIRFKNAIGIGLAIAGLAAIVYVIVWEIYLASSNYSFIEKYVSAAAAEVTAIGLPEDDVANRLAALNAFKAQYLNPFYRIPITFSEIFPMGALIALLSALLLRNPTFLPAQSRT